MKREGREIERESGRCNGRKSREEERWRETGERERDVQVWNERDERKTQGEQEGEGRVCRVIQRRGEELYLAQGKATHEVQEEDEGC